MVRKRWIMAFLLLVTVVCAAVSQELTKVAVVNMGKIVDAYFRDAAGIKEINDLKAQYQQYLTKIAYQLAELKEKQIQAQVDHNSLQLPKIQAQIDELERTRREYHGIMTDKIRNIKMRSQAGNDFDRRLQQAIQETAIDKGFSLVLEDNIYLLWYDRQDVDITDAVIQRLGR